jgi:hypothetical protein
MELQAKISKKRTHVLSAIVAYMCKKNEVIPLSASDRKKLARHLKAPGCVPSPLKSLAMCLGSEGMRVPTAHELRLIKRYHQLKQQTEKCT